MGLVSIVNYVESNKTPVTSSTAKNVGAQTFVGDMVGGGVVAANIEKQYSTGVFIGVDGHQN